MPIFSQRKKKQTKSRIREIGSFFLLKRKGKKTHPLKITNFKIKTDSENVVHRLPEFPFSFPFVALLSMHTKMFASSVVIVCLFYSSETILICSHYYFRTMVFQLMLALNSSEFFFLLLSLLILSHFLSLHHLFGMFANKIEAATKCCKS